jgi:peroxiredoxin
MQYTFDSAVSFDEGETIVPVTVGYDYTPEECNYPHAPDYAEEFEVFVFDANGVDITATIPEEDYQMLEEEAKADFRQVVEDANAY